ncbi:hypothetical protein F2Q69_00060311 [Brassica cretica]|uniref:Uncharacterized protein n=1 Tax=Brassica cretica TaxID=69181 RepID=A0A8S9RKC7_BRACR|nr:hypothetical protein F2Q69_00060311 [Brassica cretica]
MKERQIHLTESNLGVNIPNEKPPRPASLGEPPPWIFNASASSINLPLPEAAPLILHDFDGHSPSSGAFQTPSRSSPCKFPLLGSLSPFEPLEPPDPPDPPDISPAPVLLRQFIVASPSRRLSSAVHLFSALSLCFTWIVHEFLMLLCFLTSSAVASCKRWSRCRFHVLWLLALTCNPPPSLMTALTSDLFHETCALLPPFRPSCNIRWPDLKNLRRASPSLSPWAMTLLPSGKIYSDWTWCERELHSDVLLLPLDRSVKIYSSEHQVPFSPVRNPLLEDIRTSIFSP